MMYNLKLNNVNKIYNLGSPSEYHALKDVNLEFDNSGLTLILGESGSGKTTLLNVIAGLLSITSGEIRTPFKDSYASFVFQDAQLLDDFTILDNLKYVVKMAGVEDKSVELLERFNLLKYKDHKANELSGGQKERLAIIRALLLDKPILLCDEPTGNLDSKNSKDIRNILKEESKDRLVIVVSHDKELFSEVADRIITIEDGTIVNDETINKNIIDKDFYANNSNLSLKNASRFSLQNIKKSPIRYCLTILSLIISLLIIIVGLNVFLVDESTSRKNIYDDYDINYVNIMNGEKDSYVEYEGVSYEEYLDIKKDYSDVMLYSDDALSEVFNGTTANEVYYSQSCSFDILYGTNTINDNEVIISDAMAYELAKRNDLKLADLIGFVPNDYFNVKIVGIYDTSFNEKATDLSYVGGNEERTAFLTKNMIKSIDMILESFSLKLYINEEVYKLNIASLDTLESNNVIAPEGLSYNVGENTISYLNSRYEQTSHDSTYIPCDSDFNSVTVNVQASESGNTMYISQELFDTLYDTIFFYSGREVGMLFDHYNVSLISYFENAGYLFATKIDESIYYVIDIQTKIAIVELIIGFLLLAVTAILIINYVFNNYLKNRREIGILSSIWIPKKQMWKLFFLDLVILIAVAITFSAFISYFVVGIQNEVINDSEYLVDYLYYQATPALIVLLIMGMISALTLFLVNRKICKKDIVDLIYER